MTKFCTQTDTKRYRYAIKTQFVLSHHHYCKTILLPDVTGKQSSLYRKNNLF